MINLACIMLSRTSSDLWSLYLINHQSYNYLAWINMAPFQGFTNGGRVMMVSAKRPWSNTGIINVVTRINLVHFLSRYSIQRSWKNALNKYFYLKSEVLGTMDIDADDAKSSIYDIDTPLPVPIPPSILIFLCKLGISSLIIIWIYNKYNFQNIITAINFANLYN